MNHGYKEPMPRTDYIVAAVAGLISLYVVFTMSFPMSLLPVVGIFGIAGYVVSPILKRRQQTASRHYAPEMRARDY